ncbi:MAG: DUF3592 domain-containing protein [Candidatus Sericytochromatia bacterium]
MQTQEPLQAAEQVLAALNQGWPARLIRWALLAFAGCMLLMAVNLPLRAWWTSRLARDLELNGRLVSARVTAAAECPGKHGPVRCYDLAYTVNGTPYHPRDRHVRLTPGQTLTLRYAPLDPGYYVLGTDPPPPHWEQGLTPKLLISGVLGLFFGLIAWSMLQQIWQGKGLNLRR